MRPFPRRYVESFFEARFGVDPRFLAPYTFHTTGKARSVWVTGRGLILPDDLEPEFQGMRCLRLEGSASKPTSAFLQNVGPHVTRGAVDMTAGEAETFLSGGAFETESDASPGYAACRFEGDVLGCGYLRDGVVESKLPKGMRRHLDLQVTEGTG